MKNLFAGILLVFISVACDNNDACPDNMEECKLKDGTEICVPKGNC